MLAEERLLRITEIIRQRETGAVSVAELCQRLDVSPMTVRRDLDRLEQMAVLKRVHGGAIAQRSTDDWTPFVERSSAYSRERSDQVVVAVFPGRGSSIGCHILRKSQRLAHLPPVEQPAGMATSRVWPTMRPSLRK